MILQCVSSTGNVHLVIPTKKIDPQFLPQTVDYPSKEKVGTIVIDTSEKHLFFVMPDGSKRAWLNLSTSTGNGTPYCRA